jgi:hypothetical protein
MHSRRKPTKIFLGGENTKNENRQNRFFLTWQTSYQLEWSKDIVDVDMDLVELYPKLSAR